MDIAALAIVLAPFVYAVVNLIGYIRSGNIAAVVIQAAVWITGIAVTFLLSASDFAADISIGNYALDDVNNATLVLAGFLAGSVASVADKAIKAVDNTQSAKVE